MKQQRRALIVTLALALMAAWVAVERYDRLRVEHQIGQFFQRAQRLLPPSQTEGMVRQAPAWQDSLKAYPGNLAVPLVKRYDALPAGFAIDPFVANRLLQVRYGRVVPPAGADQRIIMGDANQPVWFCFHPGPAAEADVLQATEDGACYRFWAPAYDISNGLRSVGVLYLDSLGRRAGFYDRFEAGSSR